MALCGPIPEIAGTACGGDIYFKYEFEVREKPEKICIRAEAGDGAIYYVNGVPLSQPMACPIEKNVLAYDIAPFVRSGVNEFTAKVWWHESPAVYDALFGGTGTVARKNSIAYDSGTGTGLCGRALAFIRRRSTVSSRRRDA